MYKRLTNKTLLQALRSACFVVLFVVSVAVGLGAPNANAAAGVPLIMNYQALVTNTSGLPITSATYMRFVIWDSLSGGACVWSGWGSGTNGCGTPNAGAVSITPLNGRFTVSFGDTTFSSQNALPASLLSDSSRYLEIQMSSDGSSWETLSPRKQLTAVPYAYNAAMLGGLSASASGGSGAYVPVTDSSGNLTITGGVTFGASIATSSASVDLVNTTATTINFGGAATTMNIGPAGATATTINFAGGAGATGCTIDGTTGNLTCAGAINVAAINVSSFTSTGGINVSGGAISLNASSNFTTSINTGTSTGAVTIGGGAGTVAVDSTSWDISTSGAVTGVTTLALSGAITGATATNTINGMIINGSTQTFAAHAITDSGALSITTAAGANSITLDSGSTGTVNIGTSNNAKTINIGTGNAGDIVNIATNNSVADTITIGSNLDSLTLASAHFSVSSAGAVSGLTTLGLSGAITGATATNTINGMIINGSTQTFASHAITDSGALTINSATGANITLDSGTTGAVNIANGASAKAITIGNTTGATSITMKAGSGGYVLTGVSAAAASYVLCINTGTGQLYLGASASTCSTSSQRYKHDIENLDPTLGLDAVNKLRPVSFVYNDSGISAIGFIAEEAALVDEHLIVRDDQGRPNALDPQEFIPLLTSGIQQLDAKVMAVKAAIDAASDGAALAENGTLRLGTNGFTLSSTNAAAFGSRLSFNDPAGNEIGYLSDNGDMALRGRLYLGATNNLQTENYIQLDAQGRVNANNGYAADHTGYAEAFNADTDLATGTIVTVDPTDPTKVKAASPTDIAIGMVVDRAGYTAGTGSVSVVVNGRAQVRAVGDIAVGDPLAVSVAGVGAKQSASGTIVGYALEPHAGANEGTIAVMTMPGYHNLADPTVAVTDSSVSGVVASSRLTTTGDIDLGGFSVVNVLSLGGVNGSWSIDSNGLLTAVEKNNAESRTLYGLTGANVEVTLSGSSKLADGHIRVNFSPEQKDVMAANVAYRTIITTTDLSNGVYVPVKDADGFDVTELGGGKSDATFDWLVVARRKGYENANDFGLTPDEAAAAQAAATAAESATVSQLPPTTNDQTPSSGTVQPPTGATSDQTTADAPSANVAPVTMTETPSTPTTPGPELPRGAGQANDQGSTTNTITTDSSAPVTTTPTTTDITTPSVPNPPPADNEQTATNAQPPAATIDQPTITPTPTPTPAPTTNDQPPTNATP